MRPGPEVKIAAPLGVHGDEEISGPDGSAQNRMGDEKPFLGVRREDSEIDGGSEPDGCLWTNRRIGPKCSTEGPVEITTSEQQRRERPTRTSSERQTTTGLRIGTDLDRFIRHR